MVDPIQVALAIIAQSFERTAATLREQIKIMQGGASPVPDPHCPPIVITGVIPGVSEELVTAAVVGEQSVGMVQPTGAPIEAVATTLLNAYGGGMWEITPEGNVQYNGTTLFHAARLGSRAVELAMGKGQNWVRTEAGLWFTISPVGVVEQATGPMG